MTKADRIRKLLALGISRTQIAAIVGTTEDYVKNLDLDIRKGGGFTQRLRMDQVNYRSEHTDKRNAQRKRNYDRGAGYNRNANRAYTTRENEMILGDFEGTDRELARILGRTVRAIQVQRAKLRAELKKRNK